MAPRAEIRASSDRPPLPEYERRYPFLDKNAYFLYNYAAELNDAGEADKSLEAATACEKMLNDYDVQMLKADAHKKRRDFRRAEACYLLASRMCPGRFMPLYELVNVYDSTNRPDRAQALAAEIENRQTREHAVGTRLRNKNKNAGTSRRLMLIAVSFL